MGADYAHVLATVDLAHKNSSVLDRALDIAQRYGARLTLLYVIEPADWVCSDDMPMGPGDVALHRELLEKANTQMDEILAEIEVPGVQKRVETGRAKQEIVRIAEKEDIDLILIGSRGRHGLQLLLGSTADGVLNLARCDVLAVRISD